MINVCFAGITGWAAGPRNWIASPTPEPYLSGTLLAVRKAADVAGVRRGLDSLLFENPISRQPSEPRR